MAFSFYTDLGTSVFLAWTGFYGTLLPVANCWLMFPSWIQRSKVMREQSFFPDEFFFGGVCGVRSEKHPKSWNSDGSFGT